MSIRCGGLLIAFAALSLAQTPPAAPAAGQPAAVTPEAASQQTASPQAVSPQAANPQTGSPDTNTGLKRRDLPTGPGVFRVEPGTRILLNMINSVSTKQAAVGDRLYLETAFPVMVNGHIVIPQGSWVTGTVTEVKRPGRVKGRGELSVRFDSLTLPNGISRDFRAPPASVDSRTGDTLNREKDKIEGPSDKGSDARTIAETTAAGAGLGAAIGSATRSVGKGVGIGAGAGLATGLIVTMLTRGPDAALDRGTNVEMVLDRPLEYDHADLDFSTAPQHAPLAEGQVQQKQRGGIFSPFPY
jgi:type IV secretion system protein VirB10